ncbi:MAG: hypothetical protein K2X48_13370 [Chitinophagaceae bacterium]|nr:hypothetical protein [Chitinophagaceae bacterium]
MKKFLIPVALILLIACDDDSNKTDNEKAGSSVEIKTDSAEVKVNHEGISISASEDGKVELKTDGGGKIKIEKKGKDLNIHIKEN